jgi:NADPH:quinone reductase-like Zn-dependent oxidoreductase
MKAVVASGYGTPDVLKFKEIAKPVPGDDEILVKVRATTVNVGDVRIRAFNVPPIFWLPGRLSLGITAPRNPIFGMELAGDVEAVGRNVTRFKVGDAVFGSTFNLKFGAHADYKLMPADGVVALKPPSLSYEEAASIPVGGLTALNYWRRAQLKAGQKVLVYGASGSVGSYAVQIAKAMGAEVTAVCSAANAAMVKALGADHVIDYAAEDFTQNGETYHVIFDAVGKESFERCAASIKDGGYYLHTVLPEGPLVAPGFFKRTGKHLITGTYVERIEDLDTLIGMIAAGKVRPVIDRCYPFEEIAAAHSYVDTGRKKGSVVITMGHSA